MKLLKSVEDTFQELMPREEGVKEKQVPHGEGHADDHDGKSESGI